MPGTPSRWRHTWESNKLARISRVDCGCSFYERVTSNFFFKDNCPSSIRVLRSIRRTSSQTEKNTSTCTCGDSGDDRWKNITRILKYRHRGMKEGLSTCISDSSPRDILQSTSNQVSTEILFRQGAMKLKFDDRLHSTSINQNLILDLRWLRHGSIKMSTIKDNFSFLQQSFPRSTVCLLYTSPSPRDATLSRMPSSA